MYKKSSTLFLFLYFFASYICFAQLKPVYSFQNDDSVLKRNFYNLSRQKTELLIAALGKENQKDYKKVYEERLGQTEDLLLSTRTVTDPVPHKYLQSILDKIIVANPELKNIDARVIFTRDWWPNAYSMGDGTIAVNAGLLTYLDNEAELVYILGHELAHYFLDHSGKAIKKYVETINSDTFKEELKRISKQQFRQNQEFEKLYKKTIFDNRKHSRDKEAEADKWALKFIKQTGYDGMAVKTALQKLDTIDAVTFLKPLDIQQVFSFADYSFKDKWIKDESSVFSKLTEEDASDLSKKERDSLKTHPDCSIRIEALKDSLSQIKGKLFLVDEKTFNRLKTDFKVEITEQCFKNNNISRNLYYSLQMLDNTAYHPLAILSVSRGLNNIYEAQKKHKLDDLIDEEGRYYPKDYNMLLRLLNRIRLDELLAINYFFCKKYGEEMKGYAGFEEETKRLEKNRN